MAQRISVVDSRYCDSNEIVLVLSTKESGSIFVSNVDRRIDFIVKEVHRPLARNLKIIYGADANPIITLKPKVLTAHHRWEVFRADRQEPEDLIFTAKTHKMVSRKTHLDVFLASNREEEKPDFEVKGKFSDRSCTIYAGDEKIAELQKVRQNINYIFQGEDDLMVMINSNVDYIFVIALITILEKISPTFKFSWSMAASSLGPVLSIIKFTTDEFFGT